MRYLMVLFALFMSIEALAKVNCKRHKIYCAIVELRPKIDKRFAMKLSNEIYRAAKRHKVKDTMRIVAIMRQESGINMDARNRSEKTRTHTECDKWEKCTTVKTTIKETTDWGLFQFHKRTMINNNLDIHMVMTDVRFTVDFAVRHLVGKIKACRKKWSETSWACYNSANSPHHEEYIQLVDRYYNKIRGNSDEKIQQADKAKKQGTQGLPED